MPEMPGSEKIRVG